MGLIRISGDRITWGLKGARSKSRYDIAQRLLEKARGRLRDSGYGYSGWQSRTREARSDGSSISILAFLVLCGYSCSCGSFLKPAQVSTVFEARIDQKRACARRCDAVQVGWAALLWLVIIRARDTEGYAVFAGRLGIVRVVPGASHFASTASVTTCQETRLMEHAEMNWKDVACSVTGA
jgi:hypothetical protein